MATIPQCELCGGYHQPEWFCVEWMKQNEIVSIEKAWVDVRVLRDRKTMKAFWETFAQSVLDSHRQVMVIAETLLDFPDVAEASRQYAEALGQQAATLTDAEKKQAVLNAVLEQGE